ncbi:MAG: hypothetical protein H7Y42_11530 [Chitinophagaceae bacterium]|nr:hypothetical protein [Chitinophagaceae bacterium]
MLGKFFFTILAIALTAGCSNDNASNRQAVDKTARIADLDPRLATADSLVVVFYKDPYGNDSLRYTRYYTQASVTDTKPISILQDQVAQEWAREEWRRNCRGEGKIWCFTKGKVFQTLYFSTRCDDCCHVYLIKDGIFYYTRTADAFKDWLGSVKTNAIEPANEGVEK